MLGGRWRLISCKSATLIVPGSPSRMVFAAVSGWAQYRMREQCFQVRGVAPSPLPGEPKELAEARHAEPTGLAFIEEPGPLWRPLWLLRGFAGRPEEAQRFAFDRLVVQARRGGQAIRVAMDGDLFQLSLPIEFRMAPRPLRLLGPHAAGAG
ncbi:hypothetical protein [Ottowia sp.]|uniref:hypothetical protein n=1 Tax=Ottowia sp. TaxID=1898956 RepID=UPI0039E535B1